jgi:hypothetical protein
MHGDRSTASAGRQPCECEHLRSGPVAQERAVREQYARRCCRDLRATMSPHASSVIQSTAPPPLFPPVEGSLPPPLLPLLLPLLPLLLPTLLLLLVLLLVVLLLLLLLLEPCAVIVSCVQPERVVSPAETALTVTFEGEGCAAGGVYRPELEMVP